MSTVNEESMSSSSSGGMADSAKTNGSKPYAFKPGRKFGLTGQRQNHHQQQQVFVNSFTSGGSSTDGRRMSVREEQRNSWMYSLSEQEMEDKYNAICLAIRTENLTLGQRLEHQHAERDLVENNLSQEVRVLHSLFVVSLFFAQSQWYKSASIAHHQIFVTDVGSERVKRPRKSSTNCTVTIIVTVERLPARVAFCNFVSARPDN